MSLLLVNGLCTLLAFVSLGAFILIARRTAQTLQLGRAMAKQIAAASNALNRTLHALQNEHDTLRDESRKLEACLGEAGRSRRDMVRSVDVVNRIRAELQTEIHALRGVIASRGPVASVAPAAVVQTVPERPAPIARSVKLPVFVQRTVRLAAQATATAQKSESIFGKHDA